MKRERTLDEAGAHECALGLLARREHSRQELAQKLRLRGFDDKVIAPALDRLVDAGYQSDARFAEALLRNRVERHHGPLRLRMELRRHGVAESLVEAQLGALNATLDWHRQAREALRARFAGPPAGRSEWGRRVRFLERRGFPLDIARDAAELDPDGDA